MKQKTHSGSKKRIKIRASGSASAQKSCKNHLLTNKSKGQKKKAQFGYEISAGRIGALRKLMPGKLGLQARRKVRRDEQEAAVEAAVEAAKKPAAKKVEAVAEAAPESK